MSDTKHLDLSPQPRMYERETLALRHAAPASAPGACRAPRLRASGAEHLAPLTNAVPGCRRAEADEALRAPAQGAARRPHEAGDRLTSGERTLVRDPAAESLMAGTLPLGFIHGDARPRNLLRVRGAARIDVERSRLAPGVQVFIASACGAWADRPDRLMTGVFV
ncbi:hypothetical protein [Streptomyces sp. NPDC088746]|uniref:hypothetical protein n=1 Tax=Streptomyces sp. NPDC088746 TaxID=3365885 RepID=UPI00381C6649